MIEKTRRGWHPSFMHLAVLALMACALAACAPLPTAKSEEDKQREQREQAAESAQRERMKEIRHDSRLDAVAAKVAVFYFDSVKAGDVDEADYVLQYDRESRYNDRMTWLSDWEDFKLENGYSVVEDMKVGGKPVGAVFFNVRVRRGSWERRRGRLLISPSYRFPKEVALDKPIDMAGLWLEIFSEGYDKLTPEYYD